MPLPDNSQGPLLKELDDQEVWILIESISQADQQGVLDGYASFKIIGVFSTRDGARTTRQFMERQAAEINYNHPTYQIETRTVRHHPDVDEAKLRQQAQQRAILEKINKLEAEILAQREELRKLR